MGQVRPLFVLPLIDSPGRPLPIRLPLTEFTRSVGYDRAPGWRAWGRGAGSGRPRRTKRLGSRKRGARLTLTAGRPRLQRQMLSGWSMAALPVISARTLLPALAVRILADSWDRGRQSEI